MKGDAKMSRWDSLVHAALDLFTVIMLICIAFLGIFRFEISDNGRSEGSEDSLPNETTVKFISEVSSKVCFCFNSNLSKTLSPYPVYWRACLSSFIVVKPKPKYV